MTVSVHQQVVIHTAVNQAARCTRQEWVLAELHHPHTLHPVSRELAIASLSTQHCVSEHPRYPAECCSGHGRVLCALARDVGLLARTSFLLDLEG